MVYREMLALRVKDTVHQLVTEVTNTVKNLDQYDTIHIPLSSSDVDYIDIMVGDIDDAVQRTLRAIRLYQSYMSRS